MKLRGYSALPRVRHGDGEIHIVAQVPRVAGK
jgi:hypothetical protein